MYSFAYRNYKINFEIHENEVEIEKSNNKIMEKKYFLFKNIEQPNNKEITIKFGFRGLKEEEEKELKTQDNAKTITDKAIFAYNFAKIKESKFFDAIHSIYNTTQQDNLRNDSQSISVLEWHLRKFITKNLSDYFIHKDLTCFLTQVLDNYVKSEMLDINSLDQKGLNNSNGVEINLSQGLIISLEKIRHFRDISGQIIKYLGQIEDFQRSLWEKTKFIISTNYCICLDLVPETYFNEIFSNELQLKEWESYGASITSLNDTDKRKSVNKNKRFFDFISANPGLMIDTIHFTVDFKYRLLSSIQDLHLKMAGILINSDNFHGLKLLQSMFKGRFKAIYIDPPYNAKSSEILYKNNFKHSSWLCMMQNRINLSKSLLKQFDGMFVCAI